MRRLHSAVAAALLGAALPAAASAAPAPWSPPAAAGSAYSASAHRRSDRPHPAVARIVVPEGEAISFGSGTLVDAREQFGLVVTNWHVVRDGVGDVEVIFPDGFRSKARPLKVDRDWDLAALVIWRPPAPPVAIAAAAPQPGDQLTICGYGQGQYRAATGRCTQYYAPKLDLPQHMVELDVEARQGDSGGPIFNDRGELAGVLFGAGGGTTLGSFGGRVGSFLATLAPDIGAAPDRALAAPQLAAAPATLAPPQALPQAASNDRTDRTADEAGIVNLVGAAQRGGAVDAEPWHSAPVASAPPLAASPVAAVTLPRPSLGEQLKTVLAAVGVLALALQVLRAIK